MRKVLAVLFVAMILWVTNSAAEINVFLGNEGKKETELFDCKEKVYVYIKGLSPGNHTLEAFWYNPAGKQQDYTKYQFISRGKLVRLWLKIHPPTGGKLLGDCPPEFVGKWRVTIYLNGQQLAVKYFFISI